MSVIPDFRNNVCKHPHIVILGAGASLAAFPNGEKNGKKLPLTSSLVAALGINDLVSEKYASLSTNFERLFSVIYDTPSEKNLRKKIEDETYRYFYEMEIPYTPTLYDYLILSLREKDIIATFNWDPLLLQCLRRHSKFGKHLPKILFLHGNVAVGTCLKCKILGYHYNKVCHRCNKSFKPLPLLYPVEKKNYNANRFIKSEWDQIIHAIKYAYYITIFGYSAPTTDVDARHLLLTALSANQSREFSEIDIIDIKSKDEIEESWSDFFYKHHYGINKTFRDNYLWYHPRRSCDAHASAYLMNTPWSDMPFPDFGSIESMHKWIQPLIDEEIKSTEDNRGFVIP